MRSLPAERATAAGVAALAAAALAVRSPALGVPDLGQAEHQKLIAVASWRAGDLIVDGEHPALFKALVLLSTEAAGATAGALRTPSVLAGAVSCVLVAMIGFRLHGRVAGWTAGGLMAFGTISVGIDRVGKEDAVMIALALAGILCWLRADEDPRWWMGAAAFAGAAVAVKYEALPLLPALWVAGRAGLGPAPPGGFRAAATLTAIFLAVHIALNPLLLSPAQWAFLADFTTSLLDHRPPGDGSIVPTRGFAAAGEVHEVKPVWYYALYLGLKAQPVWVGLVAAGVVLAAVRRRREDLLLLAWAGGYVLAISLVPFGFARYLAPALPALALLGGAAAAWVIARTSWRAGPVLALVAVALVVPLSAALPHPSLYVNALGGGSGRAMYWTPDDAAGNLGIQRAVAALERQGVAGEVAVADPTLVGFLSGGRLSALATEGLAPDPRVLRRRGVRAVIVQPSQISLGNRALFDWLTRTARPALTVRVRGIETVGVYRIAGSGEPLHITRTPATIRDRGKREESAGSRPGTVAKARPTTTVPARSAARSTAALPSAPLPTRTREASMVVGGAARPARSGTRGRSLTTAEPAGVASSTAATTRARSARASSASTTRPRIAPGDRSASATNRAAAWRHPIRRGTADAASSAAGTERRAQ